MFLTYNERFELEIKKEEQDENYTLTSSEIIINRGDKISLIIEIKLLQTLFKYYNLGRFHIELKSEGITIGCWQSKNDRFHPRFIDSPYFFTLKPNSKFGFDSRREDFISSFLSSNYDQLIKLVGEIFDI